MSLIKIKGQIWNESRFFENKEKPKHILLIGNGIWKNGWDPFKKLISEKDKRPFINESDETWNDNFYNQDPNYLLAFISLFARKGSTQLMQDFSGFGLEELINHQKAQLENLKEADLFRKNIADVYNFAFENSTLERRTLNSKVIEQLSEKSEIGIITTNWDDGLWSDYPNVVQLHGRCKDHQTLILPYEAASDFWHLPFLQNDTDHLKMAKEKIHRYIRSEDSINWLKNAYAISQYWMNNASSLTICGLSGHIYDIELLTLLTSTKMNSHFEKVYLADPKQEVRDRFSTYLNIAKNGRVDLP